MLVAQYLHTLLMLLKIALTLFNLLTVLNLLCYLTYSYFITVTSIASTYFTHVT